MRGRYYGTGPDVGELVQDARARTVGVERGVSGAGLQCAERGYDGSLPALGEDADHVAPVDAERAQATRQAVGLRVEAAVGESAIATLDGYGVGRCVGPLLESLRNRTRGA